MREALNSNPVVQIALLGVLAAVGAFMLLASSGGGDDAAEPATPAASPPASAGQTAGGGAQATPVGGSQASATGEAATPAPVNAAALEPTPGLPAEAVRAYERGDVLAIFVLRNGVRADQEHAAMAQRAKQESKVSVFEISPGDLAKWVRITGPAGVDRTPALVTVGKHDGEPVAEVSYGFRDYDSVRQAITDARYKGPVNGYDPG